MAGPTELVDSVADLTSLLQPAGRRPHWLAQRPTGGYGQSDST